MSQDIYAFGSIVTGSVLPSSDVDILAIPLSDDSQKYPETWSVYSKNTLAQYFAEGRLFAWHLHLEAQLLYSPNRHGYLSELGSPNEYCTAKEDIYYLRAMLEQAIRELLAGSKSEIFEFGLLYTALRDIAMSASYLMLDKPTFSRTAPYEIPLICPLPIEIYNKLMLARHCSTRGTEFSLSFEKEKLYLEEYMFDDWLTEIESIL